MRGPDRNSQVIRSTPLCPVGGGGLEWSNGDTAGVSSRTALRDLFTSARASGPRQVLLLLLAAPAMAAAPARPAARSNRARSRPAPRVGRGRPLCVPASARAAAWQPLSHASAPQLHRRARSSFMRNAAPLVHVAHRLLCVPCVPQDRASQCEHSVRACRSVENVGAATPSHPVLSPCAHLIGDKRARP